jgi:hypothetical protein
MGVMNYQQIDALAYARKLGLLSLGQVAAIDPNTISSVDKSTINKLSAAQISALTTAQIAALGTAQVEAIDATDIRTMSADQIAALTPAQAAALTTSQIANLGTRLIRSLSATAIANMSVTQIASLSAGQVTQLKMEQADALTDAQVLALGSKAAGLYLSPLVIDLNNDGKFSVSVDNGVRFDMKSSGSLLKTAWVNANDGLLARDINGDGLINNGSELFGDSTKLPNGKSAPDGFAALSMLDSNHDGVINAKDTSWKDVKIWIDRNSDGHTDTGELVSLDSAGIVSLKLGAKSSTATENGNKIGLVSSYTHADGSSGTMADVWFRTKSTNAPEVKTVGTLDDGAHHDISAGS